MFLSPIINIERTTKHGIETLELMVKFISVIEADSSTVESEFNNFKSWLVENLKRELSPQEEIHLMEASLKYIQSDPITNERSEAMKYLFELEFLES